MKSKRTLIIIALLLMSALAFVVEISPVKAIGTIRITFDGPVDPNDGRIVTEDYITYTFTQDINASVVVERDNITLDGDDYYISGENGQSGIGLDLTDRRSVVVKNVKIELFYTGILLENSGWCYLYFNTVEDGDRDVNSVGIMLLNSHHNTLFDSWIRNNHQGIELDNSDRNKVFHCNITGNFGDGNGFGIRLTDSNYNNISDNLVFYNHDGVGLVGSLHDNIVIYNNIKQNLAGGEEFGYGEGLGLYDYVYNNEIKHNNFQDNWLSVRSDDAMGGNSWDNGYPSGGNYWDDHDNTDLYKGPGQNEPGSDGIADTKYTIHQATNNFDYYPFNSSITYVYSYLTVESGLGGTTDPIPYIYPFVNGSEATVNASAFEGYSFSGWDLDGEIKTENPITVIMDADHTLEARFFNQPPLTPNRPDGPTSGDTKSTYTYSTNTTDPEEDDIFYQFAWNGDSNTTVGPYASGATANASHVWNNAGIYNVTVRAQDVYGAWSNWSTSLEVNITAYSLTVRTYRISGPEITDVKVWVDSDPERLSPVTISISLGNHSIQVENDFWKASYLYTFSNWENGSTSNPRNINIDCNTTIIAYYSRRYVGTCPTLFVWNGTDYAYETLLNIHAESDVTVQHTVEQPLVKDGLFYKLSLRELDNFTSHIDQVKLYAVDVYGQTHTFILASAVHSTQGRVNAQLRFDDEIRTDLNPTETIDLKFLPTTLNPISHFIFEINGYNKKVP